MIRLLPLWLSLLIACMAMPAQAAEPSVAVEVDVSALPDNELTTMLKANLTERETRILEDGGFEVVDDADARIRVTVSRYGELGIHYRFTVALFMRGAEAPKAERTLTCELCRDSDLVTKVGEEVARMSGLLIYQPEVEGPTEGTHEAEGTVEAAGNASNPSEPNGVQDDPTTGPARRPLGRMGKAGAGLLGAGAATLVTGGVVFSRGKRFEPPLGRTLDRDGRDFGRPGVALMVSGGAAMVVGAVLLIVDRTRARRTSSAVVVPTPGGVAITGRF